MAAENNSLQNEARLRIIESSSRSANRLERKHLLLSNRRDSMSRSDEEQFEFGGICAARFLPKVFVASVGCLTPRLLTLQMGTRALDST